MNSLFRNILAASAALLISASAWAGIEIRLADGSSWRGEMNDNVQMVVLETGIRVNYTGQIVKNADLYLVLKTDHAGRMAEKVIFKADVQEMKTMGAETNDGPERADARNRNTGATSRPTVGSRNIAAQPDGLPGIFVMPIEGPVGVNIRHEEFEKMGEHLDEYGPGQILVLRVKTNGGSAFESMIIAEEIFKMRERHRVVAWIEKAISAGCYISMCCNEIYFMTNGTAGAVTAWNPGTGQSIKGAALQKSLEDFADLAEKAGRSRYIAYSMKTNTAVLSYDIDPETGEVTFYPDKSGKYILSDEDSNLSFNSSNAAHCKFSDGTADTVDQLSELLDLPHWYETDSYGRDMSKKWNDTVERCQKEVPKILARFSFKAGGLSTRIQLANQLIKWWDRCPNAMGGMAPPKEQLERAIEEWKRQLARGG